MDVMSPIVLAYVLGLLSVGITALLVGIRIGARTRPAPVKSEEEQVAAAFGVLRRHMEKKALAEMQAQGGPIWSPDPDRVAELSYGATNARPTAD